MKTSLLIGILALALAPVSFAESIGVGMTEAKLIELKGAPDSKATVGKKAIYRWRDMQVTLIDGKVDQVQVRDAATEKRSAAERAKTEAKKATAPKAAPATAVNWGERPEAGKIGTPGSQVLRVSGSVMQVLPNGVLLYPWENRVVDPYGNHDGSNLKSEPLFVVGTPNELADGSRFTGVVYPAGRYIYTSTTGADKTVYRYATTSDMAIKLQTAK